MNREQQNLNLKAILNFVVFILKKQDQNTSTPNPPEAVLIKTGQTGDTINHHGRQLKAASSTRAKLPENLCPIPVLRTRSSFGLQPHPA